MPLTAQRPIPSPAPSQASPGRELVLLALPALGALIAEPVFLLADTAMVGHLGTVSLAGLGMSATLLQTAIGLLIFLAYGTTPAVSRLVGAGNLARALEVGRDGVVLAAGLGLSLTFAAWLWGPTALQGLGARGDVLAEGVAYLHGSLPGITGMLLVMSFTGIFRGLGDAKTPLWVAGVGAIVNIVLNWALIYGAGLGVYGSGLGTSLTQWGMALAMGLMISRAMRVNGVGWAPSWAGVGGHAGSGAWLFLRSATMRLSILVSLMLAASWGPGAVAGNQIMQGVFALTALALDAIAIAAQTLISRELGASNAEGALAFLTTMLRWGALFGVGTGVLIAGASPWLAEWFGQPQLQRAVMLAALVLAAAQPLCGVVFVLDGVLIGAGDVRYLGLVSLATVVLYLVCLAGVWSAYPPGVRSDPAALAWLWAAWSFGYMAARALSLHLRARSGVWIRLGAR